MSFRERLFIDRLVKGADVTLDKILRKRRSTFWGATPLVLRVRKYKVAGEIRNQRVSVVKPQLHTVSLHSHLLGKKIPIQVTPQMLRYIEASGGLDEYLLKTPDARLMSDVASNLKVTVMAAKAAKERAAKAAQAAEAAATAEGGRREDARVPRLSKRARAVMRLREELAAARTERITRMLKAAGVHTRDAGLLQAAAGAKPG